MPEESPPSRAHGDHEPENCAPRGDGDVDTAPPEDSTRPAVREIGGPSGPEPTRYGDWEQRGRCTDF